MYFSIFKFLIQLILDFIIGYLWYSEYLFSKAWIKAIGISKEKILESNPNIGKFMLMQLILNVVTLFIHSFLLIQLQPSNLINCLFTSFLFWLAFTANAQLAPCIWEGKPISLFIINAGYRLTTTLLFSFLFYLI
jgi:hypothetical protein